jgi:copper chaperone
MNDSRTRTYKVDGMTCQGCVNSVTRAIQRLAPSAQVAVELTGGRVSVSRDTSEAVIREAVEGAGFDFRGPLLS